MGLLIIPAYGALGPSFDWPPSVVGPFLEAVDAQNRAMQMLSSASTVPAVPVATLPTASRAAGPGFAAPVETSPVNLVSEEAFVIVQAGQTLWAIAQRHGVTVEALQAANGLSKTLLDIGQRLMIPGHALIAAAAAPPPAPVPAPAAAVPPSPDRQLSLVVGDGETLWDLAQTYGVSVDAIVETNTLSNGNLIHPGQRLIIPRRAAEGPTRIALSRQARSAVSLASVFVWPASGRVTSGFGFRRHPVFGTQEMHTGIDIGAPLGTPVVSARAGTVVTAGWEGGYGKLVVVDHGDGLTTGYSHLSQIAVQVGQILDPGDLIGRVGNTGISTGPHLLFEIRVHGRPLDPLKYL